MRRFTSMLADHGIAVARFDLTGLGESSGEFAEAHFSATVDDVLSAADWLRQTWAAPSLLIGHSFGGAAALATASRIPELEGVVTIGAPASPDHVTHLFATSLDQIAADGEADVTIAGRSFRLTRSFVDDIASAGLDESLTSIRTPVLILHAPEDEIVDVANANRIFGGLSFPKSLVALDGADHLLTDPAQADRAASLVVAWADGFLPDRPVPSDDLPHPALEGEVVVSERGTGRFAQVVRVADRHALLADEPEGIGDDTGPAPYDFLLAALGTCTSMTIRMYADRKKWPLEDVTIKLVHDKIHAEDCAACETESGRIDAIHRRVIVSGPLTADQHQRLLEIADKCPVHRTLHSEIHVTTELATGIGDAST